MSAMGKTILYSHLPLSYECLGLSRKNVSGAILYVKATVAAKAEVPIADDVLPILMEQSGGRMRLILGAIANIEAWAESNGWAEVTAEHIKGITLCAEFTGKTLGRRSVAGGV